MVEVADVDPDHYTYLDQVAEQSGVALRLAADVPGLHPLTSPLTLPPPQPGTYVSRLEGDRDEIAEEVVSWSGDEITTVRNGSHGQMTTVHRHDEAGLHLVSRVGVGPSGAPVDVRGGARSLTLPAPLPSGKWWWSAVATMTSAAGTAKIAAVNGSHVLGFGNLFDPPRHVDVVAIVKSEYLVTQGILVVAGAVGVTFVQIGTGHAIRARIHRVPLPPSGYRLPTTPAPGA